MTWAKYSYVRLTIRLDGKNQVKTYRFNKKEDIERLETDMSTLLPLMRGALQQLKEEEENE